jgi:hypothetical protein
MSQLDMERVGGLYWARRTGGCLTPSERRRLLCTLAKGQWQNLVGYLRLAVGQIPTAATEVDVRAFEPPDSRLAREAEQACAEQPGPIVGHSYRTWMFGLALAALDRRIELDRESFYCAALLHDYGLTSPTPGRDFTLRSAERATACATAAGLLAESAEVIADAICAHPTPGVSLDRDGALACYLQWGAMVDVGGLLLCDIAPNNREEILRRHPRGEAFKETLAAMIRAEARAVTDGRFALLVCCGVTFLVRVAPFDP